MIHTMELLYILNRRAATYCAYRLNRHVNAAERYDGTGYPKGLAGEEIPVIESDDIAPENIEGTNRLATSPPFENDCFQGRAIADCT